MCECGCGQHTGLQEIEDIAIFSLEVRSRRKAVFFFNKCNCLFYSLDAESASRSRVGIVRGATHVASD